MSEKLSALSQFLYSLSRLPGLGFLYKYAQMSDQANYAKQNMDSAKQAGKDLLDKK